MKNKFTYFVLFLISILLILNPAFAGKKSESTIPSGDETKGAKVFKRSCSQCHSTEKGGKHKTGPNIHGIFCRKTGQAEDFSYTNANQEKGITWNTDTYGSTLRIQQNIFLVLKWYLQG